MQETEFPAPSAEYRIQRPRARRTIDAGGRHPGRIVRKRAEWCGRPGFLLSCDLGNNLAKSRLEFIAIQHY